MRAYIVLLMLLVTACEGAGSKQNAPSPSSAARKPTEIALSGPYQHKYLGLSFPESTGTFVRTNIIQFDDEAADIGVNYRTQDRRAFATVYVYPYISPVSAIPSDLKITKSESEAKCRTYFDGAKTLALRQYENSRVREAGPFASLERQDQPGYRVVFDADRRIAAPGYPSALQETDGPLTSELYLLCEIGTYWHIKYRFTYPQAMDARKLIDDLIAAVPAH